MSTRHEVFNIAADALGEPSFASDMEETRLARAFRGRWDGLVREILEAYDWNFAQTHVELARVSETPIGWRWAYNKPADCLRIVGVSQTGVPSDECLRYEDAGGHILCDLDRCFLRYVSAEMVNQTGAWPSLLRTGVGLRLAAEQNRRATQNRGAGADLYELAESQIRRAQRWDAAQRPWAPKLAGAWARSRRRRLGSGYE